ncbi:hypothetical protein WH50_21935 [Pokkaliibacter plantistimulans]|uniref:Uncharacterized protein n=1 Tax=Pokkaliibacter plantistimulans TaxID=1635171 RepID=A0ABX5LVB8_9GAMM|nr:hypothetical protein [Pokkaliibacter plantistimulans]PXF29241.1 hypothetical protein WH50_21935 [Pokkaliibacter plantistimulans]
MALLNLKTLLALSFLLGSIALRLFTGVLTYSDEPSTTLFWKDNPSFSTEFVDITLPESAIIVRDENGFPGDAIYYFVVDYGWLFFGVIVAGLFISTGFRRKA